MTKPPKSARAALAGMALFAAALSLGRADAEPAAPLYRSVHIDHLAPNKVKQFLEARRVFVDVLAKAHTTDGRGLFLQVDGANLYTLRPFATWGELDSRPARVKQALMPVPKEALDKYTEGSDTALIPPHHSEVWRVDEELSYRPAGGAGESDATVGFLVREAINPTPAGGSDYEAAWKKLLPVLAAAHYPLTRIAFDCVFGDGQHATLWLARDRATLDKAPSIESVAIRALGEAEANTVMQQLKRSVVSSQRQPLVVRRDLSSTPL